MMFCILPFHYWLTNEEDEEKIEVTGSKEDISTVHPNRKPSFQADPKNDLTRKILSDPT